MQVSSLFFLFLGMGVTFFGLICLIFLKLLLGKLAGGSAKPAATAPAAPPAAEAVPNRQEIIAAVSAALAEELGTDVTRIRILSFKKIS